MSPALLVRLMPSQDAAARYPCGTVGASSGLRMHSRNNGGTVSRVKNADIDKPS